MEVNHTLYPRQRRTPKFRRHFLPGQILMVLDR